MNGLNMVIIKLLIGKLFQIIKTPINKQEMIIKALAFPKRTSTSKNSIQTATNAVSTLMIRKVLKFDKEVQRKKITWHTAFKYR
jgi:hypothetical protein